MSWYKGLLALTVVFVALLNSFPKPLSWFLKVLLLRNQDFFMIDLLGSLFF